MQIHKAGLVASAAFFCALAVPTLSTVSFAQPGQGTPGATPFPPVDNQWHLGYTVTSFSKDGTFEEVAHHQMNDVSPGHPMEVNDVYSDTTNKIVLADPPTDCVNTGPSETNACVFTSKSATQQDDHHIRYSFKNWGGRCVMWIRAISYPPAPFWKWADMLPWSSGSPFIVVVPDGASNPTVFGKLNGANIFFTPQSPLSSADRMNFTLLEPPKVVPGFGTIYRFQASPTP